MVTDNNMLGHFDPVFVTCWVVPHQHLQYKAFCVRPVKKPQDSKASDPLTSPPNAQFYPWPQTNNHNHITQTTRRTQLHCWITSSFWCRTFWDVFQVRFSMVGRRQKRVTSHQDKNPPKNTDNESSSRSSVAPTADGVRTAGRWFSVLCFL